MSDLEAGIREAARAITSDRSINDVRPALVEQGFADLMASDPQLAIRCYFDEQGRSGRVSGALDLVIAAGHPLAGIAPVVYAGGDGSDGVVLDPHGRGDRLLVAEITGDQVTLGSVDRQDVELTPADGFASGLGPAQVRIAGNITPEELSAGGEHLSRARYAVACELLGVATRLRDLTIQHISTREQFGAPLGVRQAVRHRMADVEVAIGGSRALIESIPLDDPVAAAAAKASAGRAAVLASEWALQFHGAMGFTAEHSVGNSVRAAYFLDGQLGSSAELTRQLGAHLARGGDPRLTALVPDQEQLPVGEGA